jgi:hypothetical protein
MTVVPSESEEMIAVGIIGSLKLVRVILNEALQISPIPRPQNPDHSKLNLRS